MKSKSERGRPGFEAISNSWRYFIKWVRFWRPPLYPSGSDFLGGLSMIFCLENLCVLLQAFNTWLHVPEDKKAEIQDITQMLHNASLL